MPSKTRVYELARELGLENKETLDLCQELGIGVKSHSSSMEEAQADRVRRKAEREGLIRDTGDDDGDDDGEAEAVEAPAPEQSTPAPVEAEKSPAPVDEPAAASEPSAETKSSKPVPTTPPPGRRVVTSSGSSGPTRPAPAPVRAETPPSPPAAPTRAAEAPPAEAPPAEAPPSEAPAQPAATVDAPPADDASTSAPAVPPTSKTGKPIPPPPAPPTSQSGKPIPPPPGPRTSRAAGRPSGPPPGRRAGAPPSGSPSGGGAARPSGGRPGGGPPPGRSGPPGRGGPGGGRGGPPRQPRRRTRRRRRRNIDDLQPVDVPTYTPEDAPVPEGEVVVERMSTPQDLGTKMNRTAADVVRFLMQQGEMVTATQSLNDDMIELFAAEIGVEIRLVDPGEEQEVELQEMLDLPDEEDEDEEHRPQVITVMGHVDHGKTKLLDRIRDADVVAGEAGGITQHIGAYQVHRNDHSLTFIDTPGHEAFTAMRARGAEATDIVVLVVAADDGVMPQTEEAISHARAAEVPIVVAINKVDRENADPNRVMQQLAERDLIPEAWGGDTVTIEVSALQGLGIEELLDSLILVAEVEELTAPPEGRATGVVLESHLDIGRGPVATLLVQRGTLAVGDPVVAGAAWGRVRALINDHGEQVKTAGPSMPVQVLGLSDVAHAGDEFVVAPTDKVATKVAETREHWQRLASIGRDSAATSSGAKLEDIFSEIQAGEAATLNLIVKADVNGSLEALTESLRKVEREEVKLAFVHRGVGGITENDIQLAAASNATIIGFNVRPDRKARELAEAESVEIRTYEIIYKLIEDIEAALVGMLVPEFEEVVTGEAEVREIFRIRGIGAVAGCYVTDGVITRGSKVRFLREGTIIWKGSVTSLKRFTEDATEVRSGFECGIGLSDFQDLKQGDVIETFEDREIERT
ncbi:MAG: translation initiation factor IF-2 [Acidimicrobiales bacterium]